VAKIESPETGDRVACEVCFREVPRSAARAQECADYARYFCGDDCYQQWLEAPQMPEIAITVEGMPVDFQTAQALAKAAAGCAEEDAMLLAWRDRAHGKASPDVPECQHQPGWLAYAHGHGGHLAVNINRGAYLFVFRAGV